MSTLLHREWIESTLYRVEVWERFQIFIAEFNATGSTLLHKDHMELTGDES
jgi:hypothetical protein